MGELDPENNQFGKQGILHKEHRYMILGEIKSIDDEFEFTGYGMIVDQNELTIYRGQLVNGEKSGCGHILRFKNLRDFLNQQILGFQDVSNFIGKVNKSTYKELIQAQINICKNITERVNGKVNYLQRQLMGDSNSDWTDSMAFSIDQIKLKSKKMLKTSEQIAYQYKG